MATRYPIRPNRESCQSTNLSRETGGPPTRREFLRLTSGALAGASALGVALPARGGPQEQAAGEGGGDAELLHVALVGCGGRGTGAAANALLTEGPVQLVAMADAFASQIETSSKVLSTQYPEQVDLPEERRFTGLDAFRKAIDAVAPGGVVLLATPPAFRPQHLEYAIAKDCHVFMEKSFAVDAPGIRRVLGAGEQATRRGLKVAGGLMSRHYEPLQQAVGQVHDGAIGEVITAWAHRVHGPVGFNPRREGSSELAHQIRNYSCFTWLNGSFLLDWLIHNLDIACWAKGAWPISAQGQGGRQVRQEPDQLFDHYDVAYTFPDGTRLSAQGRHINGCWGFFGDVLHGATGCAVLGEGVPQPKLYRGHVQEPESLIWQFDGERPNPYQVEHDRLFRAIREDLPYNETERCAHAALTGILGRMAVESGKEITWQQALESDFELAPGLDELTLDSDAPVAPDAEGRYPIAVPGVTRAF